MNTETFTHLENLCAAKHIGCERASQGSPLIKLTTPDRKITRFCKGVREALEVVRNDPVFSSLPLQFGNRNREQMVDRSVPISLCKLLGQLNAELRNVYGSDYSFTIMGKGKKIAASNARDGAILP